MQIEEALSLVNFVGWIGLECEARKHIANLAGLDTLPTSYKRPPAYITHPKDFGRVFQYLPDTIDGKDIPTFAKELYKEYWKSTLDKNYDMQGNRWVVLAHIAKNLLALPSIFAADYAVYVLNVDRIAELFPEIPIIEVINLMVLMDNEEVQ